MFMSTIKGQAGYMDIIGEKRLELINEEDWPDSEEPEIWSSYCLGQVKSTYSAK